MAIANRILKEWETVVIDYKKFLLSGSSMDHVSLFKLADVNMSMPDLINSVVPLFREMVDELECQAE